MGMNRPLWLGVLAGSLRLLVLWVRGVLASSPVVRDAGARLQPLANRWASRLTEAGARATPALERMAARGAEASRNAAARVRHAVSGAPASFLAGLGPLRIPFGWKGVAGVALVARDAVVDPGLLNGLAPAAIAANGLDALTQLLESLTSTRSFALSRALALDGLAAVAPVGLEVDGPVEGEAHRIVPDRVDFQDHDVALPRHGFALVRRMPLHFRARALDPEIFGRKLKPLAAVERNREGLAVLAQAKFGRPSLRAVHAP